ncbi:transposon I [Colletotrichum truncatum]|uniref:Transposon I n=1 Tax=Colletotrichum truncatum TaxID=5467 RepID=A0ACC3YHB4_COLTU
MIQCAETQRSNMSLYLGGKSLSNDDKWAPNMQAVRAKAEFL